ncbi:MAG: hypothetical protein JOS17DRAFT_496587 [Linnemannia elongata]|nr:MAG: hypothetical protein JOS17DRAFT_496587 [Linnemannia elongata]
MCHGISTETIGRHRHKRQRDRGTGMPTCQDLFCSSENKDMYQSDKCVLPLDIKRYRVRVSRLAVSGPPVCAPFLFLEGAVVVMRGLFPETGSVGPLTLLSLLSRCVLCLFVSTSKRKFLFFLLVSLLQQLVSLSLSFLFTSSS